MIDDLFPFVELPITFEQFQRLPQNPSYKYEYVNGRAYLSPRPRCYRALLDLTRPGVEAHAEAPLDSLDEVRIRPLRESDWAHLPDAFAAAFVRVQPFQSLSESERLEASRRCLEQTRTGGDGPVVRDACYVAEGRSGRVVAGLLVTLTPPGGLDSWSAWVWREEPPSDAVATRNGRPHLTWVFVTQLRSGGGVGTALLRRATQALREAGFAELASTFLLGNHSSTLWHWRNGFRLLPQPRSGDEVG